ncbi:MAG: hypothetical protein AAFP85_15190 [Pseudomonadota bacterium]
MKIGEYKQGSDARSDRAINKNDDINTFLKQRTDEFDSFDDVVAKLQHVAS